RLGQQASGQVQGLSNPLTQTSRHRRRDATSPAQGSARNVGSPTFSSTLEVEESRLSGKPTGGRVKDRGESQCLMGTIRIAVATGCSGQDHGARNRADFRVVFRRETLSIGEGFLGNDYVRPAAESSFSLDERQTMAVSGNHSDALVRDFKFRAVESATRRFLTDTVVTVRSRSLARIAISFAVKPLRIPLRQTAARKSV